MGKHPELIKIPTFVFLTPHSVHSVPAESGPELLFTSSHIYSQHASFSMGVQSIDGGCPNHYFGRLYRLFYTGINN